MSPIFNRAETSSGNTPSLEGDLSFSQLYNIPNLKGAITLFDGYNLSPEELEVFAHEAAVRHNLGDALSAVTIRFSTETNRHPSQDDQDAIFFLATNDIRAALDEGLEVGSPGFVLLDIINLSGLD